MSHNSLKSVVIHGGVYWLGTMLNKIIGFFLIPLYTRYLQPKDYGVLEIIALSADIIGLIVGLRIVDAMFKYYSSTDTLNDKNIIVSTNIITLFPLTIIVSLVSYFYSTELSYFLTGENEYGLHVFLMVLSVMLGLNSELALAYYRIKDKSKFFIIITTSRLLLQVILNIYFLVFLKMSVLSIFLGTAITQIVFSIVLLYFVIRRVGFTFSYEVFKKITRYSIPLVPASLSMFILNFSDRFFLTKMSSLEQVGIYAVAYKFGILLSQVLGQPFGLIWQSKQFYLYNAKNGSELYNQMLTWLNFIMVFSWVILALFVDEVIKILTPERYWIGASLVPIISLSYVFSVLTLLFNSALYAESATTIIGRIAIISAVFNLILNYFLIKYFGMYGAAIATLITFAFIMILSIFASMKYKTIKWEFGKNILIMAIGVVTVVVGCNITPKSLILNLFVKIILVSLFLGVVFSTNLIRLNFRNVAALLTK